MELDRREAASREDGGDAPDLRRRRVPEHARVRAHARLGAAAEQLPDWRADDLAGEIPERQIDPGDREHAEAAPPPDHERALQAVEQAFDPRRVLADQHRRECLVDDVAHRERRPIRERLAPAREPAIRVDTHEDLLRDSGGPR